MVRRCLALDGLPAPQPVATVGEPRHRRRQHLETVAPLDLPSWAGDIRLSGVRAFDRLWDVRLADGTVRIETA